MKRLITLSFPKNKTIKYLKVNILSNSPYDLVEYLRRNLPNCSQKGNSRLDKVKIADILPIHNISGIRDISQINQMIKKINLGREVLEKDLLPNIKLILAPNNKLLLFDGTHSLLSYFLAGKKYLNQIPYLLISNETYKPVTISELLFFFPEKDRDKVEKNFEKYVVNWQAEKTKQLEFRNVKTIEELAIQFSKRNKSSIE